MRFLIVDRAIDRLTKYDLWTNAYGLGRTILAAGTLITLLFNDTSILFRPAVGIPAYPICDGLGGSISLFCFLDSNLELARLISIILLVVVASGWRPRITGVIHWWVSFSFISSSILVDGGDHITSIMTLLLIPITLTDDRKWHWDSRHSGKEEKSFTEKSKRLIAALTVLLIRVQVSFIYLNAAVDKVEVAEWINGTALYYWFTDPVFGYSDWLDPVVFPLLANPYILTFFTWSIITLEFVLFAGLFTSKKNYHIFFKLGLMFHIGIAAIHGLVSFGFAMTGALVLYLKPLEISYNLDRYTDKFSNLLDDIHAKVFSRKAEHSEIV